MTDPSSLLRAADPLRDDETDALSADEAQAIRRAMIAAIPAAVEPRPLWRRPLVLAAAAALVASVSGLVGHRVASRPIPPSPAAIEVGSGGSGERRQLQFATPGGTRIIWIFDDSLRLQESMP